MANTIFVDNNAEQILQDTIRQYESKANYELGEADVERIIIDIMSYRESLLRSAMELAMRQNFVKLATGQALDYWGELYGVTRNSKELDDSYRARIQLKTNNVAVGTRKAITERVTALDDVLDVKIITRHDDVTIPPGAVEIYPIIKQEDSRGVRSGINPTDTNKTAIVDTLNDTKFGLVGDLYEVKEPTALSIGGSVAIQLVSSYTDTVEVRAVINKEIDIYLGELSQKYGTTFDEFELERRLLALSEVFRVDNITLSIPNLDNLNYYTKGQITLTI